MYEEKDIPFYQIMDAFLQQYQKETQARSLFLDILDDTERRAAIAEALPEVAKRFEMRTRAEQEVTLGVVAIAASVAQAIVEASHILQQET